MAWFPTFTPFVFMVNLFFATISCTEPGQHKNGEDKIGIETCN